MKTYNGYKLPGFNTSDTPTPSAPRWMIVWDEKGWTAPVRRVVTGFTGKFVDSDGNEWDYGSELPDVYQQPVWWPWLEICKSDVGKDYSSWLYANKDCLRDKNGKVWHYGKAEPSTTHGLKAREFETGNC